MKATESGSRFWRIATASWILIATLAGAWSLATPIGAAPDEPAHLIKAASVVRGEFIGARGPHGEVVTVPQYVAFTHAQTCYAFDQNEAADCMLPVPGDSNILVDAPTTAGLYNPLYYALVGWPSLFISDSTGIYAMRLASVVVVSLMFGLAFAMISTWRRPLFPILAFSTALTPMVLFLSGTVNPNSLEIATTLTTFIGVLTVVRSPAGSHVARHSTIVFVAAAVAANMRGLSLLWLALAVLLPFTLVDRSQWGRLVRNRSVIFAALGTGAAVIAAGVWLLATNSLGAAIEDPGPVTNAPGVGTPAIMGFIWTLLSTFHYAQGMVGVFGWLDTPAPEYVFFAWSLLAGGLIALACMVLRGRNLRLLIVFSASLLALPPLLQAVYITEGGIIWQGRYVLPVFVCLLMAAGSGLAENLSLSLRVQRRISILTFTLWVTAQFVCYATAMRRYAVGLDEGWLSLLEPDWTPPSGIAVLFVVFAIALVISAVAAHWLVRKSSLTAPEPADDPRSKVSAHADNF